MKNNKSLYDVLGVEKSASLDEIKAAYKSKAKSAHTDKGGKHEDMVELNKAYKVLKDEVARAKYDATGDEGLGISFENQFRAYANDVFMKILANSNIKKTNILEKFLEQTKDTKEECLKVSLDIKNKISLLEEVIGRIDNSVPMLIPVLQGNIDVHKQNILKLDSDISFLEQCEFLLADCNYKVDASTYIEESAGFSWRFGV